MINTTHVPKCQQMDSTGFISERYTTGRLVGEHHGYTLKYNHENMEELAEFLLNMCPPIHGKTGRNCWKCDHENRKTG